MVAVMEMDKVADKVADMVADERKEEKRGIPKRGRKRVPKFGERVGHRSWLIGPKLFRLECLLSFAILFDGLLNTCLCNCRWSLQQNIFSPVLQEEQETAYGSANLDQILKKKTPVRKR